MSRPPILAHLEAERHALLTGQFGLLEAMAAEKADLFAALPEDDPELLRDVAARVQRNQRLLAAALDGVQTARVRIAQLRDVRDSLRTYDSQGQKSDLHRARPSIERKA